MARYKSPQHPDDSHKRDEQAQRIAAIGQQINAPLRDLSNQLTSLAQDIKSSNEKTQRSEEEYNKCHFLWVKWATVFKIHFMSLHPVVPLRVVAPQRPQTIPRPGVF